MTETTPSPLNNVMTIDDERIKNHLDLVVRGRGGGDAEPAVAGTVVYLDLRGHQKNSTMTES